jgi:ATP-dependent Clp protease ATP-binding subunit ClpX
LIPFPCSFCKRSQPDVEKLVSGPGVFICDRCVRKCRRLLSSRGAEDEPTIPFDGSNANDQVEDDE